MEGEGEWLFYQRQYSWGGSRANHAAFSRHEEDFGFYVIESLGSFEQRRDDLLT